MALADIILVVVEFTVVLVEKNTKILEENELTRPKLDKDRLLRLEHRIIYACL